MFTASMSNAEQNELYKRLTATASSNRKEVKICYVTVCFPTPVMICSYSLCGSQRRLEKARDSTLS
jgi:hypothetical protein